MTSRNVAYQAPLSMESSRQEYWSGWPFPSPGDHPNPGIEPGSPALQADSLPSGPLGKPLGNIQVQKKLCESHMKKSGKENDCNYESWKCIHISCLGKGIKREDGLTRA